MRDVLAEDATAFKLPGKEALAKLFGPAQYLGVAGQFINGVLAAHAPARAGDKTSGESR